MSRRASHQRLTTICARTTGRHPGAAARSAGWTALPERYPIADLHDGAPSGYRLLLDDAPTPVARLSRGPSTRSSIVADDAEARPGSPHSVRR